MVAFSKHAKEIDYDGPPRYETHVPIPQHECVEEPENVALVSAGGNTVVWCVCGKVFINSKQIYEFGYEKGEKDNDSF